MSVTRLKTRIPEDRQITLTLPPDFPVGEAELEIAVRRPVVEYAVELPAFDRPRTFPSRPTDPALAAEHDAFERLLPELLGRCAGKYVAIRGGAVVAVADDEVGALTEARRANPGGRPLVRRVTDQPQPIERLPTFRELPTG